MEGHLTRAAALVAAMVLVATVVGCSQPTTEPAATEPAATTPEQPTPSTTDGGAAAEGQKIAQTKCTMCHTYDRVENAQKDEAGWTATVDRMVDNGLVVTAEEKAAILEYLVTRDQ